MSFVADCPVCRKTVTIAQELVGVIVACPHCKNHFKVPPDGGPGVPVASQPSAYATPRAIIRFTFVCQRCESTLEGRSDLCSQPGRCPTCGALFVVPDVNPDTHQAVGPALVADDGQLPTPMHAYATAGDKAPTIRRLKTGVQVVVCPRCRVEMPIDADVCASCGIPFTMEGAAAVSRPLPEMNKLAVAALTVGIVGALSGPLQPVIGLAAVGLGIGAYVQSAKIRGSRSGRGFAIAGIVCGLAGGLVFMLWNRLLF
jgi:hypothetical protein